eukprot:TRINITY_DN15363_c0_g1_i1.p1 TRINITY_DN15363_c0_g1~~TRINITY_DN15363_c0_g1_i1.p1  ORF type:complete len:332 (-),score=70.96 TRINITY_DN15363_c0_g1_i1:111-1106(-)
MPALFHIVLTLSVLCLVAVSTLPTTFSTVPLLFWSGENYFPANSHNAEIISNSQLETLFQKAAGLQSQDSPVPFLNNNPPEVAIVFVEDKLRTDQFSRFASAHNQESNYVFNRLRNAVKSSRSSASCPYVSASEYFPVSDVLSQTANDLLTTSPSSSIILVNDAATGNSQKFSAQTGAVTKTLLQFLEEISLGNSIFSNGVTDFVAVYFSHKEGQNEKSLSEDDAYIGSVHQIINAQTKGNYIAMFTADTPEGPQLRRVRQSEATEADVDEVLMAMADGSNFWNTYFPIEVILIILTLLLLLGILLVGVICMMQVQTPQRFETPRVRRVAE